MIVITQPNATEEQIQRIVTRVREFGLEAQISRGASRVIIGVIGPEALLREKAIAAMRGVEGPGGPGRFPATGEAGRGRAAHRGGPRSRSNRVDGPASS